MHRSFSTSYGRVRGTIDYFPDRLMKYNWVEAIFRGVCARYGYGEIRTPILEKFDMFQHTLGTDSDIISKEIYSFDDHGTHVILRPENTVGVARAVMSHENAFNCNRLYYCGPMFRRERPQKGRLREFNQFGVELVGTEHPDADSEIIEMAVHALDEIGLLEHTQLEVNSLGDITSRERYTKVLVDFLEPLRSFLSKHSQKRLDRGAVLRILDSNNTVDRDIVRGTHPATEGRKAPILSDFLNVSAQKKFQSVLQQLDELGVTYTVNPYLMRGLDYYCDTAFEFISCHHQGRQAAVLAGGRYLLSKPSIGWAAGLDRLVLMMDDLGLSPSKQSFRVNIVQIKDKDPGTSKKVNSFTRTVLQMLRRSSFNSSIIFEHRFDGNFRKQMKWAAKKNAEICLIIGSKEMESNSVRAKCMSSGHQTDITVCGLVNFIRKEKKKDNNINI